MSLEPFSLKFKVDHPYHLQPLDWFQFSEGTSFLLHDVEASMSPQGRIFRVICEGRDIHQKPFYYLVDSQGSKWDWNTYDVQHQKLKMIRYLGDTDDFDRYFVELINPQIKLVESQEITLLFQGPVGSNHLDHLETIYLKILDDATELQVSFISGIRKCLREKSYPRRIVQFHESLAGFQKAWAPIAEDPQKIYDPKVLRILEKTALTFSGAVYKCFLAQELDVEGDLLESCPETINPHAPANECSLIAYRTFRNFESISSIFDKVFISVPEYREHKPLTKEDAECVSSTLKALSIPLENSIPASLKAHKEFFRALRVEPWLSEDTQFVRWVKFCWLLNRDSSRFSDEDMERLQKTSESLDCDVIYANGEEDKEEVLAFKQSLDILLEEIQTAKKSIKKGFYEEALTAT